MRHFHLQSIFDIVPLRAWLLCLLLPSLLLGAAGSATPPTSRPTTGPTVEEQRTGAHVELRLEKDRYRHDEPIFAQLTVANIGRKVIRVEVKAPFREYEVVLVAPNGERSPKTFLGEAMRERAGMLGAAWIDVKPGETSTAEIRISQTFDTTLSGHYRLSVKRSFPATDSPKEWLKVSSNEAAFEIMRE